MNEKKFQKKKYKKKLFDYLGMLGELNKININLLYK